MLWGLSWVDIARATAGIAIIGVGFFVLTAKPNSTLHRIFFLLALMDGASTVLFGLAVAGRDPWSRAYFIGLYWYFFLAFITLLAVFGLSFPKPVLRGRASIAAILGAVATGAALIALFAWDHSLFLSPTLSAPIPAATQPIGTFVNIAFAWVIAVFVVTTTWGLRKEPSESHRRQRAYVLGGMALAYLPYPATVTAQDLANVGVRVFYAGRWDYVAAHWGFGAACLALVASAILLLREKREEAKDERAFVLTCYAAVLAIATIGFLLPAAAMGSTLRTLALLGYPVLLGWSIVRYEVFDIDRQLRRAATVSLAAIALTIAFVLAENALENVLASRVLSGIPSVAVSGSIAAIVTAFAFVPVARASRKAAAKIVPELSQDELQERKLEIYKHSLAGALADGILREGESRTLAALRASLGISDADHQRMLSEVAA